MICSSSSCVLPPHELLEAVGARELLTSELKLLTSQLVHHHSNIIHQNKTQQTMSTGKDKRNDGLHGTRLRIAHRTVGVVVGGADLRRPAGTPASAVGRASQE